MCSWIAFLSKLKLDHFHYRLFPILILLLGSSNCVVSQIKDPPKLDKSFESHSPQKAIIYSLICPGLGQAYNKKYWKMPIIYGAGTALAYGFAYNHFKYKKFKDAVFSKELSNGEVLIDGSFYPEEVIFSGMRYFERNRDKCLIGFAALYLLNVIDAMVDAYFFRFDVSDDLTMHLAPVINEGPWLTTSIGLQINLDF